LFKDTLFKRKLDNEIYTLRSRLQVQSPISAENVTFLNRSCDWIISNQEAAWFNKDVDLIEDDVGNWREKMSDLLEVWKVVKLSEITKMAKEVQAKIEKVMKASAGDDKI
jgi:hypothetical protein